MDVIYIGTGLIFFVACVGIVKFFNYLRGGDK
jgi:hypothetical protein